MKKILILAIIMMMSPLYGQESTAQTPMNFPYVNNSLKLYATLGLPVGVGLLYAPEIRSSINNNILHVLNFDVQFIGFDVVFGSFNMLTLGTGVQYSVGTLLADGGRFYVDLIGVGVSAILCEASLYPVLIVNINVLGFQNTLSNGFYWALRSRVSLGKTRWWRNNQLESSFGAYLALGYDFGKKINPKDYEPRAQYR